MGRVAESMQKGIKGSKIVFINGAGHEIYVDKAQDCFKELDSFIQSLRKKVD